MAYYERAIRLPSSSGDVLRKVQKFVSDHREKHGKAPSQAECAEHVGITAESLGYYLYHQQGVASLDRPTNAGDPEGQNTALLDLVADDKEKGDDWLEASLQQDSLFTALWSLADTPRGVLVSYYGLYGNEQKNLTVLARDLNVSRERVRQIKEKALRAVQVKMNNIRS